MNFLDFFTMRNPLVSICKKIIGRCHHSGKNLIKKFHNTFDIKAGAIATLPFLPLAAAELEPVMVTFAFLPLFSRSIYAIKTSNLFKDNNLLKYSNLFKYSYFLHLGVPVNQTDICHSSIPSIANFVSQWCLKPNHITCVPFFITYFNQSIAANETISTNQSVAATQTNTTVGMGVFQSCYPTDLTLPPEPFFGCSKDVVFRSTMKAFSMTHQTHFERGSEALYGSISHEATYNFYNDFCYFRGFSLTTIKAFRLAKTDDIEFVICTAPETFLQRHSPWPQIFAFSLLACTTYWAIKFCGKHYFRHRIAKENEIIAHNRTVVSLYDNIQETISSLTKGRLPKGQFHKDRSSKDRFSKDQFSTDRFSKDLFPLDLLILIMEYLGEILVVKDTLDSKTLDDTPHFSYAFREDHKQLFLHAYNKRHSNQINFFKCFRPKKPKNQYPENHPKHFHYERWTREHEELRNNLSIDTPSIDNQSFEDGQALDNRSLDSQSVDNQSLDNHSLDSQALDNQSIDIEPADSTAIELDRLITYR